MWCYLSSVSDSQAVQGSDGNMDDLLALEAFHHLWLADVGVCAVTQPEVVSLTPGNDTGKSNVHNVIQTLVIWRCTWFLKWPRPLEDFSCQFILVFLFLGTFSISRFSLYLWWDEQYKLKTA